MLGRRSGGPRARAGSKGKERASKSESKVDVAAIESLYNSLRDEEEDCIAAEGVMKMCETLGIDASADIEVLIIAFRFQAKTGAMFTKTEFCEGMARLGCESFAQLKAKLPRLKTEDLYDDDRFREFYRFVFQISREGTEKTIPKEAAMVLLPMVLGADATHLSDFVRFLESDDKITRCTFDQWCQFLEFTKRVSADLSDYDEDSAWPVLFDDYVEWYRAEHGKK